MQRVWLVWLVCSWGGAAATDAEQKLSATLLAIVEHYKQQDPVGIPGVPIPDPLPIPPMNQSFSVGRMNFRDMQLFGLRKFRVVHVTADVAAMRVQAALRIDVMDVVGNYTLKTWISSAQGPFTVQLKGVFVQATANLEVQSDGRLEAQDIAMDVTFKDMALDFQGLGFFASMFQGVMNSVGAFVFDSIKPFVLSEANANIRAEVNRQAARMPQRFANSIAPCDQVLAQARSRIRALHYDPYRLQDYNSSAGIAEVYLTHSWLYGGGSFHRTRDVVVEMRNNTLRALLEVGTQRLRGTTHWEVALVSGVLSRAGVASFSVEYIRAQLNASQSLDTRNRPRLDDLQLQLGNMQLRIDGTGTLDYVLELAANVLPNLVRYQIMDALERPIKRKIQTELDKIDVERLLKENAAKLDDPEGMAELGNFL